MSIDINRLPEMAIKALELMDYFKVNKVLNFKFETGYIYDSDGYCSFATISYYNDGHHWEESVETHGGAHESMLGVARRKLIERLKIDAE
jgi:hypothetical protein